MSILKITGQTNYQLFDNISPGSEASVISCFAQDNQGLMWIGTDKGLFSYDGYSTQQHFVYGQSENSRINSAIPVDSNLLYLGSDNGIHIYNYKTDCYEKPEISFPTDVRAMVTRNEILWIGTLNGLYRYNLETKQLKKLSPEDNPGLPHQTIYSLIHAQDDNIYIGTYNGFCRYLPGPEQFEKIEIPINTTRSNLFINSLLEDTVRNCIWVGTEGNLFKYTPNTNKTINIEVVNDNSIKSLAIDENNRIIAGTDNGVYIYHEEEPVQHIVHDSRNTRSLSNNIVWNIFKDKDKNIWLGTDYGISLAKFNNSFQFIPIDRITGTGEGNHFYSLYKDHMGDFWFGGTNGLIKFNATDLSPHNTTWYKMGNKAHPLPHNRIRYIFEDSDKDLWIATDGSVNRYDRKKDTFIHYNIIDSTGTYNANWAYNILEDNKGQLWIATCLGGIFVVNKENLVKSPTGNYIADYNFSTRNGLSGMFVNQLIPDKSGNIWVLHYRRSNLD